MSVQKVGRGATYRRPVQGPATWAALIALGAAPVAFAIVVAGILMEGDRD